MLPFVDVEKLQKLEGCNAMNVGIAALSKWQEYCALSGTPASSLVSLRILFNAEGVKSFPEKFQNTGPELL